MLRVQSIEGYLRVTGYPDGSDWIFLPKMGAALSSAGAVGDSRVWYVTDDGSLRIVDAITRRYIAMVKIDMGERGWPNYHRSSRNGRHLYYLAATRLGPSRLYVIDVIDACIVRIHEEAPNYLRNGLAETQDGKLLMSTTRRNPPGNNFILMDPWTGAREISGVDEPNDLPSSSRGFEERSPSGRYWLRIDPTRMQRARSGDARRYGLNLQLWEAAPIRFVRRIQVAWLKANELPGGERAGDIWEAHAEAVGRTRPEPDGLLPPRADYPEPFASDDAAWKALRDAIGAFTDTIRRGSFLGWQEDEEAVWMKVAGDPVCVGMDGTVSRRFRLTRMLEHTLLRRTRVEPVNLRGAQPLPGRQARLLYYTGQVMIDGSPQPLLLDPLLVSPEEDGWQPREEEAADGTPMPVLRARIRPLADERQRVRIPFGGWTPGEVEAAIDRLTVRITSELETLAVENSIEILFEIGGGNAIKEADFFNEVAARFPGAVPALRRLIERYVEPIGPPSRHLFTTVDEESSDTPTQLLGTAVRALGIHDQASLPLIQRYGMLVDRGHEYFFASETARSIIRAHGWTDPVIDFMLFIMLRNYYNTLDHYSTPWRDWGFDRAVAGKDPAVSRSTSSPLFQTSSAAGILGTLRFTAATISTGWWRRLARTLPGKRHFLPSCDGSAR